MGRKRKDADVVDVPMDGTVEQVSGSNEQLPVKRGRGRPKGSKNKPKVSEE